MNSFELGEKIYESNNSLVFKGILKKSQEPVVVKILKEDYPTPSELARYRQEYELMQLVQHPSMVTAHGLEAYENTLALILEDFGGASLDKLYGGRASSPLFVLDLGVRIAQVLGELHDKNLIHKDINPNNIVYNPDKDELKLIDFGIATRLNKQQRDFDDLKEMEGTPSYVPPEQTGRVNRPLDYRCDYYSLGVTLYELLTGTKPFTGRDTIEVIHAHLAAPPEPPHERTAGIPHAVSEVILKLLAKDPEDRYKSTHGLIHDLNWCRDHLKDGKPLVHFQVGRADRPRYFEISRKLYGREKELTFLRAAFEDSARGAANWVLVSGWSGIGKTALVKELYQPITRKHGYFVSGKYDQFKGNIPYAAVGNALRDLVRQLSAIAPDQLSARRERILKELEGNGGFLTDFIPELARLLGDQESKRDLSPEERRNYFNNALRALFRAVCAEGYPLVLFIDDLQWVDSASLALFRDMADDPLLLNFLFIGAYRDNEVEPSAPLLIAFDQIEADGASVRRLHLEGLQKEHVGSMIADSLHMKYSEVESLTHFVFLKTRGNPFFARHFLRTLEKEGLLKHQDGGYGWDVDEIEQLEFTDNVVALVIHQLRKLPPQTQAVLRLSACLGNRFDLITLALVEERGMKGVFEDLFPALQEGLLLPLSNMDAVGPQPSRIELVIMQYKFLHDRVQQAAYATIPEAELPSFHHRISRILLDHLSEADRDERIYELVDHLNKSGDLVSGDANVLELIELNLKAAMRCISATAYEAASGYLDKGLKLLRAKLPKKRKLEFELLIQSIWCAYYQRDFSSANEFREQAKPLAVDDEGVISLRLTAAVQFTTEGLYVQALAEGAEVMQLMGVPIPMDDTRASIAEEDAKLKRHLADRDIDAILEGPELDPRYLPLVQIMDRLMPAAFIHDPVLYGWFALKLVNMAWEYGKSRNCAHAFGSYGMVKARQGQYDAAYRYCQLGMRLAEHFEDSAGISRVSNSFCGFVGHWRHHLKLSRPLGFTGYQAGIRSGDHNYACYNLLWYVQHTYYTALPLGPLSKKDLQEAMAFAKRMGNVMAILYIGPLWRTTQILSGRSKLTSLLDTEEAREILAQKEGRYAKVAAFQTHLLEAQVALYSSRYEDALKVLEPAAPLKIFAGSGYSSAVFPYIYGVSLTACRQAIDELTPEQVAALHENRDKLAAWREHCRENADNKYLLLVAEEARLRGQLADAVDAYDQAIQAAEDNGFTQELALTAELAGRFWLQNEKPHLAAHYLRRAHQAYGIWGATPSARRLEDSFPRLFPRGDKPLTGTGNLRRTYSTATGSLDLETFFKASEVLSGALDLEGLVPTMMRLLIENAGAQRGYLIVEDRNDLFVIARGDLKTQTSLLEDPPRLRNFDEVSQAIVSYVANVREDVVLGNAAEEGMFTGDAYVRDNNAKSILCSPITTRSELFCIIYLENDLSINTFDDRRLDVLRILTSQMSISLENARLYNKLKVLNVGLEQKVIERTHEVRKKNEQILSSLAYAKNIQQAVLPRPENLLSWFEEVLVILEAKDIVSGDFYWCTRVGDHVYAALVDCTGHGVPGAFMSIIGYTLLNQIVRISGVSDPSEILESLHEEVRIALGQDDQDAHSSDGMELGLCRIDLNSENHLFAGARFNLYVAQDEIVEYRGTRRSIGGKHPTRKPFTSVPFRLGSGGKLYMFSDGFADQPNRDGKKFSRRKLIEALSDQVAEGSSMAAQRAELLKTLKTYSQGVPQRDDISVLGLKLR